MDVSFHFTAGERDVAFDIHPLGLRRGSGKDPVISLRQNNSDLTLFFKDDSNLAEFCFLIQKYLKQKRHKKIECLI